MKRYLIENRLYFDSHLMVLQSAGQRSELTANEAELLCLVLDGEASKAAVMARVWTDKGVIVTDSSYHQLTRALRLRLAEHGIAPALLKTLPRHGVRFMGQVRRLDLLDARQRTVGAPDFEPAPEVPHLVSPSLAETKCAPPPMIGLVHEPAEPAAANDARAAQHWAPAPCAPEKRSDAAAQRPDQGGRMNGALHAWHGHRVALLLPLAMVTLGSAFALALALSRLSDAEAWLGRLVLLVLIGLLTPGTLAGSVNLCRALGTQPRVGHADVGGLRRWRAVQFAGPVATGLLAHAGANDPLALLVAMAVGACSLLLTVTLPHHRLA